MKKTKHKNIGTLVGVWFSDQAYAELKAKAKADDRTLSELIRHLLKIATGK